MALNKTATLTGVASSAWLGAEENEGMNTIDNMTADEAKQLLAEIAARFRIGEKVRTAGTIMTNIDNSIRRSECLSRIEAHHTETLIDEDGEECEESLLKWGEDPEQYIKTYMAALSAITPSYGARVARRNERSE